MNQLCPSQSTLKTMNSGTVEMSERSKKEETIKGTTNVAFHFLLYGLTAPQKQMWILKSTLFDLFYLLINSV